jgi:alpha-tubulin suppressor-like RCC1 family protein
MKKILVLITVVISFSNAFAQCYSKVSTGKEHSLVIKSDGTLYSCGYNAYGQLGRSTPTFPSQTVLQQVGTDNDWQDVATGTFHSLAIKTDGSLWACGSNGYGELGDGANTNRSVFTRIGTGNNWLAIDAGGAVSIGLKNDGTLWTWGKNQDKQLGDGTNIDRNVPVQIGAAEWQAVSCGSGHFIAIKTNSTLWGWGRNDSGQSGVTIIYNGFPVQIGTDTNWQKVACGDYHSLAIKQDSSLWGWGYNLDMQLGDGTTTNRSEPTHIGTADNWKTIDGGAWHSLGLQNDGSLWWWGRTGNNLLYGAVPTRVGESWNWQNLESVSASGYNSAAIQSDGSLFCWGENEEGSAGVGSNQYVDFPTQISCTILATESAYSNVFSVYPNPVKDILHVQYYSLQASDKISIIDVTGKKIQEQNGNSSVVNVQNLRAGIYILQIISASKTYQQKIIKL